MKALKYFLTILFILYGVLCIALYVGQDRILFLPDKIAENHVFRAGEEVEIEVKDNVFLNCVLLPEGRNDKVILYLHGNKGSNRRCMRQASMLSGNGYDVFMPDYRGFGKSDGVIESEDQLYADVQKVYDHLVAVYREENIVIAGYSLGTGMATYLAAYNNPQLLILNSPFLSICDLKDRRIPIVPDFLIRFPFNNEQHLKKSHPHTIIFHGMMDEVIPFDSAEKLERIDPEKIHLVPLPDTGHRRAIFHDVFRNEVKEAIRSLNP